MAGVPLPPGATVTGVEHLLHDGTTRPLESDSVSTPDGPGLELHVEDAAGEVMHTVVHYKL
mgnify:FL=1